MLPFNAVPGSSITLNMRGLSIGPYLYTSMFTRAVSSDTTLDDDLKVANVVLLTEEHPQQQSVVKQHKCIILYFIVYGISLHVDPLDLQHQNTISKRHSALHISSLVTTNSLIILAQSYRITVYLCNNGIRFTKGFYSSPSLQF